MDIPFYFEKHITQEYYNNYFYKNYIVSKKFVSSSLNYTDDKLTATLISTWASQASFLEFVADKYCHDTRITPNRKYDIDNEITVDNEIEKEG